MSKLEDFFELSFESLKVQLEGLFDHAGGDQAINLLNILGNINEDSRAELLNTFLKVAKHYERNEKFPKMDTLERNLKDEIESIMYSKKKYQKNICLIKKGTPIISDKKVIYLSEIN